MRFLLQLFISSRLFRIFCSNIKSVFKIQRISYGAYFLGTGNYFHQMAMLVNYKTTDISSILLQELQIYRLLNLVIKNAIPFSYIYLTYPCLYALDIQQILSIAGRHLNNSLSPFPQVLHARDIIPLDPNGFSDPFVIIELLPHRVFPHCSEQQTNVHKKTLHPIFDECFEFR